MLSIGIKDNPCSFFLEITVCLAALEPNAVALLFFSMGGVALVSVSSMDSSGGKGTIGNYDISRYGLVLVTVHLHVTFKPALRF